MDSRNELPVHASNAAQQTENHGTYSQFDSIRPLRPLPQSPEDRVCDYSLASLAPNSPTAQNLSSMRSAQFHVNASLLNQSPTAPAPHLQRFTPSRSVPEYRPAPLLQDSSVFHVTPASFFQFTRRRNIQLSGSNTLPSSYPRATDQSYANDCQFRGPFFASGVTNSHSLQWQNHYTALPPVSRHTTAAWSSNDILVTNGYQEGVCMHPNVPVLTGHSFTYDNSTAMQSMQSPVSESVHAAAALTSLSRCQVPYTQAENMNPSLMPKTILPRSSERTSGACIMQSMMPKDVNTGALPSHIDSPNCHFARNNATSSCLNVNDQLRSSSSDAYSTRSAEGSSARGTIHPGPSVFQPRITTKRAKHKEVSAPSTLFHPVDVVGNLHKTVVHTSHQMLENMEAFGRKLRECSRLTEVLCRTERKIRQHGGLAGEVWDGPGCQMSDARSRYPRGEESVEGILDEATVLEEKVYNVLRNGLTRRLKEVRDSAIMVEEILERRLMRQLEFRTIPMEEADRRMEYIKYKFLKARLVVVDKYKMFVRVLKWVSLSPQRVRRGSHSREQNYELRLWLFRNFRNPYPNAEQKASLMRSCTMTDTQISNWFINARVRIWKPCISSVNIFIAARETIAMLEKSRAEIFGDRQNSSDTTNDVFQHSISPVPMQSGSSPGPSSSRGRRTYDKNWTF